MFYHKEEDSDMENNEDYKEKTKQTDRMDISDVEDNLTDIS